MMSTIPAHGDSGESEFLPVHRFTVDEYRRLGEIGVLTPEDHVELLEGRITDKMNHHPSHSVTVKLVDDALRTVLPDGWITRTQDSVSTDDSEPEPDVAVVRGTIRDYASCHPTAADSAVLVEAADSSLSRDRYKADLYGRAGFSVYWIVNLVDRCVQVYTQPSQNGYVDRQDFAEDESVPIMMQNREIARVPVAEVLP